MHSKIPSIPSVPLFNLPTAGATGKGHQAPAARVSSDGAGMSGGPVASISLKSLGEAQSPATPRVSSFSSMS